MGRYGRGYSSRYTKLEMDEVSLWNRPLSIDEIRQWRHLTKTTTTDPIFTGLVAYYQFNETNGNISVNKTVNTNYAEYRGTSGANHNASNAPVFEGKSEKVKDFRVYRRAKILIFAILKVLQCIWQGPIAPWDR